MTVRRLIGVYNSKGTLTGELAYVIGRSLGRTRCALCDITHGHVRPKREWREQRSRLPVRFETYHLDDCPPQVAATAGRAPAVLAETDDGLVLLLGPDELETCGGDPAALVAALEQAVFERDLRWPDSG